MKENAEARRMAMETTAAAAGSRSSKPPRGRRRRLGNVGKGSARRGRRPPRRGRRSRSRRTRRRRRRGGGGKSLASAPERPERPAPVAAPATRASRDGRDEDGDGDGDGDGGTGTGTGTGTTVEYVAGTRRYGSFGAKPGGIAELRSRYASRVLGATAVSSVRLTETDALARGRRSTRRPHSLAADVFVDEDDAAARGCAGVGDRASFARLASFADPASKPAANRPAGGPSPPRRSRRRRPRWRSTGGRSGFPRRRGRPEAAASFGAGSGPRRRLGAWRREEEEEERGRAPGRRRNWCQCRIDSGRDCAAASRSGEGASRWAGVLERVGGRGVAGEAPKRVAQPSRDSRVTNQSTRRDSPRWVPSLIFRLAGSG